MRALWSFWTRPFMGQHGTKWVSTANYLMSWVLSVELAKRFFPETSLVTDDEGARILIDQIGLEFSHVSTELNKLDEYDPKWFTLGKLFAYKMQTEPFVHLDNDVFLSQPLPPELISAPVFAQNPEYFYIGASECYLPDEFENAVNGKGWFPEEWKWYRSNPSSIQKAVCCGILGSNHLEFIQYYSELAISILDHPSNKHQLSALEKKRYHTILLEQYLLPACIDYHQTLGHSPYQDVYIKYLFESLADAYENAAAAGFTHLMLGNLKNNKHFAYRLAKRIKRDFPQYYERCIEYGNGLNIKTYPNRYVLLTTFNKREEVSLLETNRVANNEEPENDLPIFS